MIILRPTPQNATLYAMYLINLERQRLRLPVFLYNPRLVQSAEYWLLNLQKERHFQLTSPSGLLISSVISNQQAHWNTGVAILHRGDLEPATTVKAVLNNEKNNEAVLNPAFTQMGIARNPNTLTWVLVVSDYVPPAWLRYQLHQKRKP